MAYCVDTLRLALNVVDDELEEAGKLAAARRESGNAALASAAAERLLGLHDVRSKIQRHLYEAQEGDLARARGAVAAPHPSFAVCEAVGSRG